VEADTDSRAGKTREVLEELRGLGDGDPASWWRSLPRDRWPDLFPLLNVAADLPRLEDNATVAGFDPELWPDFAEVTGHWLRLQRLVDHPALPPGAEKAEARGPEELEAARAELEESHCVTVEGLLPADDRSRLDAVIDDLAEERLGRWGQVERDEAPALHRLTDAAVGGEPFRRLTGFDPERDEYTVTLSLQDLQATGIGWHRDLYWPKEWVGEDVFAVLYGLGDDTPEKGGAFLYYVPWQNRLGAVYRKRHQATILWNGRRDQDRILHAVEGYRGDDTSRHLIILQCHRR